MKARLASWGAWVRFGDDAPRAPLDLRGALVALDRDGARACGIDGEAHWSSDGFEREAPLEAHVAVTTRCAAGCTGCYQNATAHGEHVSRTALTATLDALARDEIFTVAFGGGEPLLRTDLGELAALARARGLTPVVTTSGLGMTAARAAELAAFAQVNVSYDGADADYERVRGFDGATHAERAIELLVSAGVRVGVNVVLTRETFPRIADTVRRARALGAVEAQLLRYKPAGRAASLDYLARRLTRDQVASLSRVLRDLHAELSPSGMSLRIDCALVCFLSADPDIMREPGRLSRAGIFGCEADAALTAVRADGARAPCSFAPQAGDVRAALDAFVAAPPEPCRSCPIQSTCRGGCRVVAGFDAGDRSGYPFALAPDPECPRVVARARGASGS